MRFSSLHFVPVQMFAHNIEISYEESTPVCYLINAGTVLVAPFWGACHEGHNCWPWIMMGLVSGLEYLGRQIDRHTIGQDRSATRLELNCRRDRSRLSTLRTGKAVTERMVAEHLPAAAELHLQP